MSKHNITTLIEQDTYNQLRHRAQGEGIDLSTLLERLISRQQPPSTHELLRRITRLERRIDALVDGSAGVLKSVATTSHLEVLILDALSSGPMKKGALREALMRAGQEVTEMPMRQALERLRARGSVTLCGRFYELRATSQEE